MDVSLERMFAGSNRMDRSYLAGMGARTVNDTAESKRIHHAARDFESVLLTSLFQKMQESVAASEEDDAGASTFRDIGAQQLAQAVSASGGIGIANVISKALTHENR